MSRWQRGRRLSALLGYAGLFVACQRHEVPDGQRQAEPKLAASAAAPEAESAESRACAATLSRLETAPALPGAVVNAGFERGYLLGRARAEPVAFVRTPQFDTQAGSLRARALREQL